MICSASSRERGIGHPGHRGIDHHDLAGELGAVAAQPLLHAHRVGPAPAHHRRESGERLQGRGSAGAVRRDADVALELADRELGLVAERPSTRPTLNPRSSSRCWRATTSSPASRLPGTKVSNRSPRRQRASSRTRYVALPTAPSTDRPRCCWKARTARSSASSKTSGSSGRSSPSPRGRAGAGSRSRPDCGRRAGRPELRGARRTGGRRTRCLLPLGRVASERRTPRPLLKTAEPRKSILAEAPEMCRAPVAGRRGLVEVEQVRR